MDRRRLRARRHRPSAASRCGARSRPASGWWPTTRFLRFFTLQGGASNFALTGYAALLVLFLVRDLDLDPAGSAS